MSILKNVRGVGGWGWGGDEPSKCFLLRSAAMLMMQQNVRNVLLPLSEQENLQLPRSNHEELETPPSSWCNAGGQLETNSSLMRRDVRSGYKQLTDSERRPKHNATLFDPHAQVLLYFSTVADRRRRHTVGSIRHSSARCDKSVKTNRRELAIAAGSPRATLTDSIHLGVFFFLFLLQKAKVRTRPDSRVWRDEAQQARTGVQENPAG